MLLGGGDAKPLPVNFVSWTVLSLVAGGAVGTVAIALRLTGRPELLGGMAGAAAGLLGGLLYAPVAAAMPGCADPVVRQASGEAVGFRQRHRGRRVGRSSGSPPVLPAQGGPVPAALGVRGDAGPSSLERRRAVRRESAGMEPPCGTVSRSAWRRSRGFGRQMGCGPGAGRRQAGFCVGRGCVWPGVRGSARPRRRDGGPHSGGARRWGTARPPGRRVEWANVGGLAPPPGGRPSRLGAPRGCGVTSLPSRIGINS